MTKSILSKITQYDRGDHSKLNRDDIRFIELLRADERFFLDFMNIVRDLQTENIRKFRANTILGYMRYVHQRRYKGEKGPYAINDHHGRRIARLVIELGLVPERFFDFRNPNPGDL